MPKARLVDVARAANVSAGAVWRTLSNDSTLSITPETRRRILTAAKDLGYVSDARAGQLRSGVSTVLGVLIHDLRGSYAAQFLYHISIHMAQMGKEVILGVHTGDTRLARYHVERFRAYRTSGVLVITSTPEPAEWVAESIKDAQTGCGPVITVSFGEDAGGRPGLHIDYDWECKQFVKMAVADGRSELILAMRNISMSRAEKFRAATAGAHVRNDVVEKLPNNPDILAAQVVPRVAEARRRGKVAVMTSVDTDAVILIRELQKRGLSVPKDVAVLGYGNLLQAELSSPAISTVDVSGTVPCMVDKVLELLKQIEAGKPLESREYPFRPGTIIRESFTPPAGWEGVAVS